MSAPDHRPGTHTGTLGTEATQLRNLEPVFHRRHHIHDANTFDEAVSEDFWEVGASGRVYDRATVRTVVLERLTAPVDDADRERWSITDFTVQALAPETYLATYLLHQPGRHSRRTTIWTRDCRRKWVIEYHQGTLVTDSDLPECERS